MCHLEAQIHTSGSRQGRKLNIGKPYGVETEQHLLVEQSMEMALFFKLRPATMGVISSIMHAMLVKICNTTINKERVRVIS
jgi:hypothetical protein